jgi:hypothetical protein
MFFIVINIFIFTSGTENYRAGIVNQDKLEKKFGQSSVFAASTLLENGGTLKSTSPASLLKEAIHVIGCGYEDKTAWGKEVCSLDLIKILFDLTIENNTVFLILFSGRLAGFMDQLQKIS